MTIAAELETERDTVTTDLAHGIDALVRRVQASVVRVVGQGQGVGSGVVWRINGGIVTNDHVVAAQAGGVAVELDDGRVLPATVAARHPALIWRCCTSRAWSRRATDVRNGCGGAPTGGRIGVCGGQSLRAAQRCDGWGRQWVWRGPPAASRAAIALHSFGCAAAAGQFRWPTGECVWWRSWDQCHDSWGAIWQWQFRRRWCRRG